MGGLSINGPNMAPSAKHPLLAAFPDSEDQRMLDAFERQYGKILLPPVLVIVPAFNEAMTIEAVLASIPSSCTPAHGTALEINVLVMVDGATDNTLDLVLNYVSRKQENKPKILVCASSQNRGQGAAYRVAYAIARLHGARYLVTLDADGQYDVKELPTLLEPLLAGKADFVTGSRVLGRTEQTDVVRKGGVYFFAWLASVLTGKKLTDTSYGFRAMRAEVTAAITLRQPQYQGSELLMTLLCRGFRVVEQPMLMLKRPHGESKKGNNLIYGFRYARVLVGTWLRERGRQP